MKKLFLLSVLLIFACSSDDDNSSEPNDFFGNHLGVWKTTINGAADILIDVDVNGISSYNKLTTDNCYNYSPPITGGSTVIESNTADEYIYDSTGIPAQNVFAGEDLDFVVNELGYNTVDIAGAYLHTSETIISFSEGIFAGNIDLLTVTGNLGKQSSNTFNVCRRSFVEQKNYKNYSISKDLKESFR